MEALFQTEVTAKILRYLQFRISQKFSVGKTNLTLLPSAEVAACFAPCLNLFEQQVSINIIKHVLLFSPFNY